MVQQRRAMPDFLGDEQEEMGWLWCPVYRCLSLEQAAGSFPQYGSLDCYPFTDNSQKDAHLGGPGNAQTDKEDKREIVLRASERL